MVADESSSSSSSSSPSPSPEQRRKHKEKRKVENAGDGHKEGQKTRKQRTGDRLESPVEKKKKKSSASPRHERHKLRRQLEPLNTSVEKVHKKRTSSETQSRSASPVQQKKHKRHQNLYEETDAKSGQEEAAMGTELRRRHRSHSASSSLDERQTRNRRMENRTRQREKRSNSSSPVEARHTAQSGLRSPLRKHKPSRSYNPPVGQKKRQTQENCTRSERESTEMRKHHNRAIDKHTQQSSRQTSLKSRKPHKRNDRDELDGVD